MVSLIPNSKLVRVSVPKMPYLRLDLKSGLSFNMLQIGKEALNQRIGPLFMSDFRYRYQQLCANITFALCHLKQASAVPADFCLQRCATADRPGLILNFNKVLQNFV